MKLSNPLLAFKEAACRLVVRGSTRCTIYGVGFILAVIYQLSYIHVITINVGWLSWFEQVPRLQLAMDGNLRFSDLVTRFGEHGMLGYNILSIVNLKLFHYNALWDAYLYLLATSAAFVLLYFRMLKRVSLGGWEILSHFLALFVWFSIVQKTAGGMDTQVRLSVCFVVMCALLFDWYLGDPARITRGILVVTVVILGGLVFGTSYTFGWFGFFYVVLLLAWSRLHRVLRWVFLLMPLIAFTLYVMCYPFLGQSGGGMFKGVLYIVGHPILALQFMLAYLGGATLGHSVWEQHPRGMDWLMLLNGVLVFLLYCWAVFRIFKDRIYRITWLPFLLIGHVVGVGLLLLVGRFPLFGWKGGTNFWYSFHHKLGLLALVWMICCVLFSQQLRNINHWNRRLATGGLLYLIVMCTFAEVSEWRQSKHIRAFFEGMLSYALAPDYSLVDRDGNTPMKAPVAETRRALEFYTKYRVGFAYDVKSQEYTPLPLDRGSSSVPSALGGVWHSREGGGRWIGHSASMRFLSGPRGYVMILGYAPDFQRGAVLSIEINGVEKRNLVLNPGLLDFRVEVEPNSLVLLTLRPSIVRPPSECGGDQRELSLIINTVAAF